MTKTWLDLRSTLQSELFINIRLLDYSLLDIIVDYEKIVSQHGRSFLWTTLMYYTPIQVMLRQLEHFYLEDVAGPFDEPV